MKGATGGPMNRVADPEIDKRREKADAAPATTRGSFIAKERRLRRVRNYTPEYQAWLDRQAKRGRNP